MPPLDIVARNCVRHKGSMPLSLSIVSRIMYHLRLILTISEYLSVRLISRDWDRFVTADVAYPKLIDIVIDETRGIMLDTQLESIISSLVGGNSSIRQLFLR